MEEYVCTLRQGKKLSRDEVVCLCEAATDILSKEPNVVACESPVTIVGDLHGQFDDLLEILKACGDVANRNYLFLGDFVDRGLKSVETLELVVALKVMHPSRVHLIRGNHETRQLSQVYGFYDEVLLKYGNSMVWKMFTDLFDYLPIGCLLEGRIFCTHGGLSPHFEELDELRTLDRVQETPHEGILCDLLWSDPCHRPGWGSNQRGAGFMFGPDISDQFTYVNGLSMICRAHQMVLPGYAWEHNRQVLTIFSAPKYCGHFDNQGAVMNIDEQMGFDLQQFCGAQLPEEEPQKYELSGKISAQFSSDMLIDSPLVRGPATCA